MRAASVSDLALRYGLANELCEKYCWKSLKERINPFYIDSYGENYFSFRTLRFRNDLCERIMLENC